jgi:bis(5'-nucleosyl)-tetraphosphatase (symmetrical)
MFNINNMAIFAIGDLQGCYEQFRKLLDLVGFDRTKDRLWLVGDIVNRGPDSLKILRFVKGLTEAVTLVLGNHDLHLLMVAEGCSPLSRNDTIQDILSAPDREELLHWLRQQKLLHLDENYAMVHAGLLPSWSIAEAHELANSVEATIRGEEFHEFCAQMYGDQPDHWNDKLSGYARLRVIVNAMTRIRVCTPQGKMNFKFKGMLKDIPQGYLPWFDVPNRASGEKTIIFGHWSALGLQLRDNLIALDTGCLWGGALTAIRLDDRKVFQVPCEEQEATRRWQ